MAGCCAACQQPNVLRDEVQGMHFCAVQLNIATAWGMRCLGLRVAPRHKRNCRPMTAALPAALRQAGTPRVSAAFRPGRRPPMRGTCLPGAAAGRAAGPAAPPGRFVPELTGAQRAAAALRPGGLLPHRHQPQRVRVRMCREWNDAGQGKQCKSTRNMKHSLATATATVAAAATVGVVAAWQGLRSVVSDAGSVCRGWVTGRRAVGAAAARAAAL